MMNKRIRRTRGYLQIVAVAVLLALAVLIYGLYYIDNVREKLWDSTVNTIIGNTEQAGSMITGRIETEQYSIETQCAAFERFTSNDVRSISVALTHINSKRYPVVMMIGDTVYPETSTYDTAQIPETLDTQGEIIPPYLSSINGKRVLAVAHTVKFQDGVQGTLIKEISVNDLNSAFFISFFQNQGHSYLVDQQGEILFRSTDAKGNKTGNNLFEIFAAEQSNDAEAIGKTQKMLKDGYAGWSVFSYSGENNLYYFTPVRLTDWYLVSVVSENIIRQQTDEILMQTFILAGIILLGFVLLICLLVYREHQNRKEIERENTAEKQMLVASNSQVKTVILAIDPRDDSYKLLSHMTKTKRSVQPCASFAELAAKFAPYLDEEYREEYLSCFSIDNLKKLLTQEHKSEYREFSFHQSGKKHWFAAEAVGVRLEDGKDMIVYSARLIDDAKREEEEKREILQNALSMAEEANKAKTSFLNNMSHDIRTPMNAIIGFTALAISHIDDKEQVVDYLKKINTSGNHLLSLINDVLDMSRIESGTIKIDEKRVHLPDLIHDIRTIIQSSISAKQIDFFIDTVDVINEDILCDKLRLSQILLNLLGNAVKYTGAGGTISVKVIQKPCSRPEYACYEFRVKDTGIGMSKEFQKHIFETFTREYTETVNGIQGTGLGMAITKNIVDMMGGTISVSSEAGTGSEFVVTLQFRICGTTQRYEPIPELQGARVLVADDESDTTINISNMLRQIGMRPDWTLSGKEAVIRTKEAVDIQDEYAVYIIDYLMPDMNGIETVRRIRALIGESAPIIVLTAYEWTNVEKEAREAGVTAFCEKPLFMSELRDVLSDQFKLEKPPKPEPPKAAVDFTGKKILLVEDNELNREIAATILRDVGFEVESVSDGIYAVEAVSNSLPGQYDLILMDIQMPQMDGYTATREIRTLPNSSAADIPIIALTANAFETDKRKAMKCGMNGYIPKPIEIDNLMETIASVLS